MAAPFRISNDHLPTTDAEAEAAYLALCEATTNALAPTGAGRPIDWIVRRRMSYLGAMSGAGIGGLLQRTSYEPGKQDGLFQSLQFACLIVEKYKESRQIYVPELDADVKAVDQLFRFWKKEGGVKGGSEPAAGYDIAAEDVEKAIALFHDKKRPKASREVLERVGANILLGAPLPPSLRQLAALVLSGFIPVPKKPQKEPNQIHRDTLLAVAAEEIQARIGIPLGANLDRLDGQQTPPICGATIVGAVLTAFDIPVNPRQAVTIVNERKKLPTSDFPRWNLELPGTFSEAGWYLRENAIFREVITAVRLLRSPLPGRKP